MSDFPGDEIIPTKQITYDREGQPTGSVSLYVTKDEAENIARSMVTAPHRWPGVPNLICKTASVQQIGCGDFAQIDATYDCYNFPITETVDIGVQMQTLPSWFFCWADERGNILRPVAQGEEPCRQIRTQEISRSFSNATIPTWVFQNQGCVNSGAMTTFSCSCAPETLLYKGATASRTIQKCATIMWSITCKYSYNPFGWNKYFNNVTGEFQYLYAYDRVHSKASVRYRMYPMANLTPGFPGSISVG